MTDPRDLAITALRAVLDLHKPEKPPAGYSWIDGGTKARCAVCSGGDPCVSVPYPCLSVQSITDALEGNE